MKMNNVNKLALVSTSVVAIAAVANAQETINVGFTIDSTLSLETVTPISFGVVSLTASTRNGDVATVTVATDGDVSSSDGEASLAEVKADGTPGVIRITNGQPNANVSISAIDTVLGASGGEDFKTMSISSYTFAPAGGADAATHALGNDGTLELNVGATLGTFDLGNTSITTSSDSGAAISAYADASYEGQIEISVTY